MLDCFKPVTPCGKTPIHIFEKDTEIPTTKLIKLTMEPFAETHPFSWKMAYKKRCSHGALWDIIDNIVEII